jgi:putative tryptophan/tyrosine transport system substrate-binding protein
VKRRDVITLLGSATVAWPLSALAQQPAMPLIGFLNAGARDVFAPRVDVFRRGLSENGYTEGRNVAIEYRWAEGKFDRLPVMAADLVRRNATVIAAFGPPAALAAKAATSTIPIVFVTGNDPVQAGLVASLNRPSGNVTGVYLLIGGMEDKRLGLLRDLVPQAGLIGVLINPRSPDGQAQASALQAAAHAVGQQILVVEAGSDNELDGAFATLAQHRASALVITSDIFFNARRERIVALPARYAIPAIHPLRGVRRSGRFDELWDERARRLLPEWNLRRPHPERRQAERSAGAAVHQVRVRHESQGRQDAWPRSSARTVGHRRRGD